MKSVSFGFGVSIIENPVLDEYSCRDVIIINSFTKPNLPGRGVQVLPSKINFGDCDE